MAIIVTKPFTLNSADGEKRAFNVGDQITGKLADHWYVKAHTEEVEVKKEAAAEKKAKAEEAAKASNNPQG